LKTLVYLAHPVRHADPTIRRMNYLRAVAFGRLLAREGHAPIVPGATVAMVTEGYPTRQEELGDPMPMEICLSILRAVYEADGRIEILLPDTGPMTEGCVIEVNAWIRWHVEDGYKAQVITPVRWVALGERMKAHGLEEVWTALRSPADLPRAAKVLGVTC
jgi:hypothetical protein